MTELINEKKCKNCSHHTGDACDNSNSDHYGHMLTPWHQACGQYDDLKVEIKRGEGPWDGL